MALSWSSSGSSVRMKLGLLCRPISEPLVSETTTSSSSRDLKMAKFPYTLRASAGVIALRIPRAFC